MAARRKSTAVTQSCQLDVPQQPSEHAARPLPHQPPLYGPSGRARRDHIIASLNPKLPVNVDCPECEAILRELLDARQADLDDMRQHLFEAARSSGREPEEMRNV